MCTVQRMLNIYQKVNILGATFEMSTNVLPVYFTSIFEFAREELSETDLSGPGAGWHIRQASTPSYAP
jgi:hypothetical protein